MSKLEDRETRRKSIVSGIIEGGAAPDTSAEGRGRPKADRELKKRISLSVLPSLYDDIQKIAYVQRKSISTLVDEWMRQYREAHQDALSAYDRLEDQ